MICVFFCIKTVSLARQCLNAGSSAIQYAPKSYLNYANDEYSSLRRFNFTHLFTFRSQQCCLVLKLKKKIEELLYMYLNPL